MRKYLLHVLIISFVFLLTPTVPAASYAGEIETCKEKVRNNPDDARGVRINTNDMIKTCSKYFLILYILTK